MSTEIRQAIYDMERIPRQVQRNLRPRLARAAAPILADARRRAAWSSRIPAATRVSTSFSSRRPGVSLVTSSRRAPHARAYENLGDPGVFRHPVYGNQSVWVAQATRPFLYPAVRAGAGRVEAEIAKTVDQAIRAAGFR